MGHQIIKQPDGLLCVFSSIVDQIILADATPEELSDYYADRAADQARKDVAHLVEAVVADEPRKVYYQFTMTYAEAVKEHQRRGGRPDMIREAK